MQVQRHLSQSTEEQYQPQPTKKIHHLHHQILQVLNQVDYQSAPKFEFTQIQYKSNQLIFDNLNDLCEADSTDQDSVPTSLPFLFTKGMKLYACESSFHGKKLEVIFWNIPEN